eukprot:scaffold4796_cov57-Attheya_sp.AAC.4
MTDYLASEQVIVDTRRDKNPRGRGSTGRNNHNGRGYNPGRGHGYQGRSYQGRGRSSSNKRSSSWTLSRRFPHPRYVHCDMFVPRPAVYTTHPRTAMCRSGADRKRQCLTLNEARQASEHVLMAKGVPLDTVPIFKYLGRLLANNDDD